MNVSATRTAQSPFDLREETSKALTSIKDDINYVH